jgi:DNA-binding SARP family transcriptional activator
MRRERHPAGTTSPADSRAAEGLQFRVLGPLDVIDANTPIIVPPGRQTLLLSALLTEVGVAVGRHRLVQVL